VASAASRAADVDGDFCDSHRPGGGDRTEAAQATTEFSARATRRECGWCWHSIVPSRRAGLEGALPVAMPSR